MTSGQRTIDLRALIDDRPFSPYQWLILALCFLCVFIDGFDTQSVGFIAPALVQTFQVKRESLGPVLSAALLGLAIGALVSGPVADRIGRKGVLVGAVALFGLFSIASAFATSIGELTWMRLATGLGLGAAMPNAATLMAEYCPQRRRSLLVTLMFCGFTFGAALGGFIAAWLTPAFGWRSVFVVGGAAPLVLAVALAACLPESVRFMAVRGRPATRIAAILRRVVPGAAQELDGAVAFTTSDAGQADANPVRTITRAPLLFGTLMLWAVYFCGLMVIFLFTSWLPTLLRDAGFSLPAAANITALFQLGGTVGGILVAWAMDRFAPHKALGLYYLAAAACIFAVSQSLHSVLWLSLTVLGAGFFTSGAQTAMSALGAAFYPTTVRATGVSWMLGIGRTGAIVGAYVGGPLLALGWGFSAIFMALAVPAVLAGCAVAMKGLHYGDRMEPRPAAEPVKA
jgi:AAHS family 4-hydroxybenzoate transporter-like MFS transporter